MKTPRKIAYAIVNRFSWGTNVMREWRLVGQQHIVAQEIERAIAIERIGFAATLHLIRAKVHAHNRGGDLRKGARDEVRDICDRVLAELRVPAEEEA